MLPYETLCIKESPTMNNLIKVGDDCCCNELIKNLDKGGNFVRVVHDGNGYYNQGDLLLVRWDTLIRLTDNDLEQRDDHGHVQVKPFTAGESFTITVGY